MKNKSTIYALLVVVLLIWGYISYKIYLGVKGDEVAVPMVARTIKTKQTNKIDDSNYELALDYRDPFLNKAKAIESVNINYGNKSHYVALLNTKSVVSKPVIIQEPINWDLITFKGCIKNPTTNKIIAMVQIHSNQHLLSEGAVSEGVKVLKLYKDSIRVVYKNETKTITR
jgi:hypothetical protein